MMNLQDLGSKESLGVKFKCGTFAELCLKLWFESFWYFYITESGWFWKRLSRNKVPNNHFLKSVWKSSESIVELWSVISNQIINYQFPHRRFSFSCCVYVQRKKLWNYHSFIFSFPTAFLDGMTKAFCQCIIFPYTGRVWPVPGLFPWTHW